MSERKIVPQSGDNRVTLEKVKNNKNVKSLIYAANDYLEVRGYTEHGLRHVGFVSKTTANILRELGYDERVIELGAIAGWLHDIGNSVNRKNHGLTGAAVAHSLLREMKMDTQEIAVIMAAIGNHEEEYGIPVNPVSAALILADKADAHRTRVRMGQYDPDDIHDRVNYSIKKNFLVIDKEHRVVRLVIFMDDTSSMMEYFQIYLTRMVLSESAAAFLKCRYELVINDVVINNHRSAPKKLSLAESEKAVSEE
ncbi:MAG: HD domain-containing protein [Firmicutes bacterium]|nr:HD domain-containing protein [Bacillota bacterium]